MTALLWLLSMVPPSALFLIAGIWVVRKKYGGVRHVLGVAAIVVGMALVAITLIALPGITTTFETTATNSNSSSLEHEVIVGGVGITLGRAVLYPNERVTLFYIARDTAEELDGAIMADSAEITSSDGRLWLADGHAAHQPKRSQPHRRNQRRGLPRHGYDHPDSELRNLHQLHPRRRRHFLRGAAGDGRHI